MHDSAAEAAQLPIERTGRLHAGRYPSLVGAAIAYLATGTFVLLGVALGLNLLSPCGRPPSPQQVPASGNEYVDTLTLWDGQWYLEIATTGYRYYPNRQSNVAFFPVYPLLVGLVHRVTRLSPHFAGLFVSNAFLLGAFLLLNAYVRNRAADTPPRLALYAMLAFGLFPTTFFMRMAYTESLFIFLSLSVFLAMDRKCPLVPIAILVGLATGTRATGVALLAVMAYHVWERSDSWRRTLGRLAYLGPLALVGLVEYLLFQWWAFGEPLAFVQTREHWRTRPPLPFGESLVAVFSGEPIWSVFSPSTPGYWASIDPAVPVFLSYHAANAVLFILAIVLVGIGAAKKWLSGREILFAVTLMLMTYTTVGYPCYMASQGRYVSVVFPIYLVLGQLLCRVPAALAVGALGLSALYLAAYSAMLAAGYFIV